MKYLRFTQIATAEKCEKETGDILVAVCLKDLKQR